MHIMTSAQAVWLFHQKKEHQQPEISLVSIFPDLEILFGYMAGRTLENNS